MFGLGYFSMLLHQRFGAQRLRRLPEMDMAMLDENQDAQYSRDGEHGALAVLYDFFINSALKISPQRGQALDVACGSGQLLAKLAVALPEMRFIGTDISPHMLGIAEENARRLGASNLRFKKHSMYELDTLAEGQFDLITCSLALHHCDTEDAARQVLSGMWRLLQPRGTLVIFDILRPKTGELALAFANRYNQAEGSWYFQDSLDSYKAAFTFEELEAILKSSGIQGYRHVMPTVGNFFQLAYVTRQRHSRPAQVSHLKYWWQKRDYLMIKLGFLGKIK